MSSITPKQLYQLLAAGERMSNHLQKFLKELEDRGDAADADQISELKAAIDSLDDIQVEIEVF